MPWVEVVEVPEEQERIGGETGGCEIYVPQPASCQAVREEANDAGASSCLDRGVAVRLLSQGVFLSTKVPPITKMQGLVLLMEARLDSFVREFKSLVREVLSGCQLSDFQATPIEIGGWLEKAGPMNENGMPPNGRVPGQGGHFIMFKHCKEVDEKMQFDMQSKLEEYLKLLEQIKQRTTDERTAVSLLQEVSKDEGLQRYATSGDKEQRRPGQPASDREAEAVYEEAGDQIPGNSDQTRSIADD